MPSEHLANKMLGYPQDARLLILNADDYGYCYTINVATIQTIKEGIIGSCTLMTPCPWADHGIQLLKENPEIPFGVHLTAISEAPIYRWGPLLPKAQVPSLVDEAGYSYSLDRIEWFMDHLDVKELEQEFRAQIEYVLKAGLKPTHVDSHCHVHTRRKRVYEMVLGLAKEYGLATRVHEHDEPLIAFTRELGFPGSDHPVVDSYLIENHVRAETYTRWLRDLPAGLTEWALHPSTDSAEMRAAIGPSWAVRTGDYAFFMSDAVKQVIEEEGIILLTFKDLQPLWQEVSR